MIINPTKEQIGPEPCFSMTVAKNILESPRKAWWHHRLLGGHKFEATAAMDKGTLIHQMILGGTRGVAVLDFDSFRTNASKEARDAATAEGKLVILKKDMDPLRDIAETLKHRMAEAGIDPMAEGFQREMFVCWDDCGTRCLGALDLLSWELYIVADIKTTSGALTRKALERTVTDRGYHIQAAGYLRALATEKPETAGRMAYIIPWVQTVAPYDVAITPLSGAMIELGDRLWCKARDRFAACLRAGKEPEHWPGVGNIGELSPPAWAFTEDED